ncbi:MAG: hypothetical protein NDJ89_18060 [Oligoflexia bacterium]|nr:hypothetical protein [Oligoflexia bacterium]
MKIVFFLLTACVSTPSFAFANVPGANPEFSGRYKILSCSPECAKIQLDLGAGFQRGFSRVKALSISVIDQLPESPSTCDGEKPFEFNITLLAHDPRYDLPVKLNNIENDPANWRKICDGTFATSRSEATLRSRRARITLLRSGLDRYTLHWEDDRYRLAASFELRKVSDRL